MDKEFWETRWATGQLGFHLPDVNANLVAHHGVLAERERILVPLCGKTYDLDWLVAHGHQVVGVELVERAILDWFEERAVAPERAVQGGVVAYRAGALTLLNADIFTLDTSHVGPLQGVWDRAALIALAPETRVRYVAALRALAGPAALLLVTLVHGLDSGPPFSVDDAEVRGHFGAAIRQLACADVTAQSQNLVAKGAQSVFEHVYALPSLV